MSERRERIHIRHELPKTRRCALLEVARSSAYYRPEPVSAADLALMRHIDEIWACWGLVDTWFKLLGAADHSFFQTPAD